MSTMSVQCLKCRKIVSARLTTGTEIYPHREDLYEKKFYKCDTCGNSVGTHPTGDINIPRPLGSIAYPDLKKARIEIHKLIDPLWKNGPLKRAEMYRKLSVYLGVQEYHTALIDNLEKADKIKQYIIKEFYSE